MSFLQTLFREDDLQRPARDRTLWLYLLLLLLAGLRLTWDTDRYFDLIFYDETEYMYKGLHLAKEQLNTWGPSYNAWYFLLSFFEHSPIGLYYLNYKVLITGIPMLLCVFLYVYGSPAFLSFLFSLSYLMLNLHTGNFTQVSHFCLLCLLAGFIAARYATRNEHKLLALLTAAWISTYARQEFLVIALGLFVLWLIVVIRQRRVYLSGWHAGFLLAAAGLYAVFGFITFKGQGIDRSYFAFLQHFYLNYSLWQKKAIPLEEFAALDLFNGAETMFGCMLANPALFAKHVATNIGLYGVNLFKYIEDFLLPKSIFHYLGKGKHVLFGAILIALIYQLINKRAFRYLFEFVQSRPLTTLAIGIFFGWSFFSIVMIYPNRHYIVMQFGWYMLAFAFLLKNYWPLFDRRWLQVGAGVIFFVLIPTGKDVAYFNPGKQDHDKQPNLSAVNYLRKHDNGKTLHILTPEKGFYAYLPENYSELFPMKEDINPYKSDGNFDLQGFLDGHRIDIIYMNERMQQLIGNVGKTTADITREPEKFGFRKVLIRKNLSAYLLVKNGTF